MASAHRPVVWIALGFPWLFIWQGLDFTDQGYLVTGYRCFFRHPEVTADSGHMWLTNLIGASWDAAFGSLGLVSQRGLWALCMSLGLWLAYRVALTFCDGRVAAIAVLASSVFLADRRETWFSYNTSSSLLLVIGAACLLKGLVERRRLWLVGAGGVLGMAPFARFPNILGLALLSAIALAAWIDSQRRRTFWLDATAALGGCVGAAALVLFAIKLRGDGALYWDGLRSLFAPSMQDAGYSSDSLFQNFLKDEGWAIFWGLAVGASGVGLARVLAKLPKAAGAALVMLVAAACAYALAVSGKGWRWVVPGTLYVVLGAIAFGVWQRPLQQRIAAFAGLVLTFVAPLGSNNGIKNAHMGMWLALPLMLALLYSLEGPLVGQAPKLALLASLVLAGEGIHRGITYTYRESLRSTLTVGIDHPQLRAQFTSAARARTVTSALRALDERVATDDYLLAYEGTPLLQYLTRTRPYLNRPWIMGWESGNVVRDLAREAPVRTGCLPLAVLSLKSTRGADWPAHPHRLEEKPAQRGARAAIKAFLREHGYRRRWTDGFFEILEPPGYKKGQCR